MNLLLRPIMPPGQRYPIPQQIWTKSKTTPTDLDDDDEVVPIIVAIHARSGRT